MTPMIETFVMHFGEMGSRWGFNRTVGQMYALLVITEKNQGCTDTIVVNVTCQECAEIYSGPTAYFLDNCDSTATVCLDIDVSNASNYQQIHSTNHEQLLCPKYFFDHKHDNIYLSLLLVIDNYYKCLC